MMENEKVEEMARTLCGEKEKRCEYCESYECEFWIESSCLYSKGYRKASEVAREIFSELEATFYGDGFHYFIAMPVFDILKKKYGGDTNDGE